MVKCTISQSILQFPSEIYLLKRLFVIIRAFWFFPKKWSVPSLLPWVISTLNNTYLPQMILHKQSRCPWQYQTLSDLYNVYIFSSWMEASKFPSICCLSSFGPCSRPLIHGNQSWSLIHNCPTFLPLSLRCRLLSPTPGSIFLKKAKDACRYNEIRQPHFSRVWAHRLRETNFNQQFRQSLNTLAWTCQWQPFSALLEQSFVWCVWTKSETDYPFPLLIL